MLSSEGIINFIPYRLLIYLFQSRIILHAGKISSTRTIRSTSSCMENAHIHTGASVRIGCLMDSEIVFIFIGLSILPYYDGSTSTAIDALLQFT